MNHSTHIRTRWFTAFAARPSFMALCDDCDWIYDAKGDRLDAVGHAKFHHERAERTVR